MTERLRIFIGYDERQPIAAQVLMHSIYRRSSVPVSITPLRTAQLPMKRRGLTDFTYSRYMVPHLCNFWGVGIFMDADMLVLGDVAELASLADKDCPVSVVKGEHKFEWPSMMVFQNGLCSKLTPGFIETQTPNVLETWAYKIGELPREWNHCVGYDKPRPDAKLVHYTQGIPCLPEVEDCEYSNHWKKEHRICNSSVSWEDIMGNSVHAKIIREKNRRIAAGESVPEVG